MTRPSIDCIFSSTRTRQRGIVERGELFGRFRLHHPDQAGAVARQRHLRERAGLGVEFGRDEAVLAAVAEIEHERGLRIGLASTSRCRRPARASESRPSAATASGASTVLPSARLAVTDVSPICQSVTADCRQSHRPCADSAASSAANSASFGMFRPNESSPISLARKVTVGTAHQPRRRIDDAHHLQRRRMVDDAGEHAERHRACAAPGSSARWCAGRPCAVRDRADVTAKPACARPSAAIMPGRPGAGNRYLEFLRCHASRFHAGAIEVDIRRT